MTKAAEWSQQPNETPGEWLARLQQVSGSGTLTRRDRFVFTVLYRLAALAAAREEAGTLQEETVALGAMPEPTQTPGLETNVHVRPKQKDESLALTLVKDGYRSLSEQERRRFVMWQEAGCPEDN